MPLSLFYGHYTINKSMVAPYNHQLKVKGEMDMATFYDFQKQFPDDISYLHHMMKARDVIRKLFLKIIKRGHIHFSFYF